MDPKKAEEIAVDEKLKPIAPEQPKGERGGQEGPEPTRFGDWEKGGRCTDF